jgi:hypothetical protein
MLSYQQHFQNSSTIHGTSEHVNNGFSVPQINSDIDLSNTDKDFRRPCLDFWRPCMSLPLFINWKETFYEKPFSLGRGIELTSA